MSDDQIKDPRGGLEYVFRTDECAGIVDIWATDRPGESVAVPLSVLARYVDAQAARDTDNVLDRLRASLARLKERRTSADKRSEGKIAGLSEAVGLLERAAPFKRGVGLRAPMLDWDRTEAIFTALAQRADEAPYPTNFGTVVADKGWSEDGFPRLIVEHDGLGYVIEITGRV